MTTPSTALQLAAAAEAIYPTLGAGAARVSDDGYVGGLHETARACGEVSLALRDAVGRSTVEPTAAVVEVLDAALDGDETGALAVYATTMVVLPRLLVALRDARELGDPVGPATLATLATASDTVVAALRRLARHAHDQDIYDDPVWQAAARDLARILDDAGYAESLVVSR